MKARKTASLWDGKRRITDMAEILEFKRLSTEQHGVGEAVCMACGHEWAAAVPTGVEWFECPECKTHKGHWKYSFYPSVGDMVRVCNCKNDLFYITPEGHMCANCGIYQRYGND